MSHDHTFCPACGHNITADETVVSGDWTLSTEGTLYKGAVVPVSPQQSLMLHTLAAAKGKWVKREVVGKRIAANWHTTEYANLTSVQLSKARKRAGVPLPVESLRGSRRGLRWIGESE